MKQALLPDAWLGGLLGRPAFHLLREADPATHFEAPAFVDAKVSTADIGRASALLDTGFRLIDTNIQLDRAAGRIDVPSVGCHIRAAGPEDAGPVQDLAATAFRFDRFHADPHIPAWVADRIKGAWAGNYFKGARGDRMVVAAEGGSILGFLQILDRSEMSIIDLIAVAPGAQGRGIATAMIAFAFKNAPSVSWHVGTQIANVPSLRFYERLGFRTQSSQYVFHRHID